MNRKDEEAFLTEQLEMVEMVDNADIGPALKAGLSIDDLEWNQRLDRPWTFHPTDAKAERELRIDYYVRNGIEPASAAGLVS